MTPQTKKFDGKTYHLSVSRVTKASAEKIARRTRKHGFLARTVKEERGRYSVYSHPHPFIPWEGQL